MSKILIMCLLFFSGIYADTIIAKQPAICCPTKDKLDSATQVALTGNKSALLGYIIKNHCTVVSKGQKVIRVDSSFTLVKIINLYNYQEYWCPREIQ